MSGGLNDLEALSGAHSGGTSWTYDWSDHVGNCMGNSDLANNGIEFVPMVWGITNKSCVAGTTGSGECTYTEDGVDPGAGQSQNTKETIVTNIATPNNGTVKWLLGYNEPDFQFQSDLTPKQAAAHWADLEWIANVNKERSSSAATLGLVGPAVNYCDSTCTVSNAGCCTVVNDANVSGQMPASGAREQIFRWLEHFYDECQTTFTIPKDGGTHVTYNGAAGHNCQIDAQAVHSYSWYGIWSVTPLQKKAGDLGGLPTHCSNLVTDADEDGTDCGGEDCTACDPNVKAMFHRLSQQVWVTEFAPTTDDCNYANCEADHVKNADKYIDNWVNLNGAPGTGNTALENDDHVARFAWFMPKVTNITSLNNGSLLQAVTNQTPTPFNPVPSGQNVCPANDAANGVANTTCDTVGHKYAHASWQTSCTPSTCTSLGANCGSIVDGCGGILYCGTCSTGTCGYGGNANVCGGGAADAGTDSGTKDSGTSDSGTGDSGTSDAALTALTRTGWTAVGNPTNGTEAELFDGITTNRWDSNGYQKAGDVLTVDMKADQTFSEITMDSYSFSAPAQTYNVDVSTDDTNWTNVLTDGTGPGSSGRETVTFAPHTARYIRITLEGSLSHYWSIAEFNVWH